MQGFTELDLTIMIDDQGNYIVDRTDNDPVSVWCEAISNDVPPVMNTYRIKLRVPTPKPIEVTGELPATIPDGKPLTLTINS